jgi:hypothetical protein
MTSRQVGVTSIQFSAEEKSADISNAKVLVSFCAHINRLCQFKRQEHANIYFLTYLLTPGCRTLFEKLIGTQLVKKYPAFLRNPKVHNRINKSLPLDPILSQPNPVRPIDPCLHKIHFMLSSHLRLGLPSGLLPSGLPTKTL